MTKKATRKKTPPKLPAKSLETFKKEQRALELYNKLYGRLSRTWDSSDACEELRELWEMTR
jgi:hypothetical protein